MHLVGFTIETEMWCYFISPNVATLKYNESPFAVLPVYGVIIIRLSFYNTQATRLFELTQLLCDRFGIG